MRPMRDSGGSGYERTDFDYNDTRTSKLAYDYRQLTNERWRQIFLEGLPAIERVKLIGWLKENPE